jgi:hypothetical protein
LKVSKAQKAEIILALATGEIEQLGSNPDTFVVPARFFVLGVTPRAVAAVVKGNKEIAALVKGRKEWQKGEAR